MLLREIPYITTKVELGLELGPGTSSLRLSDCAESNIDFPFLEHIPCRLHYLAGTPLSFLLQL